MGKVQTLVNLIPPRRKAKRGGEARGKSKGKKRLQNGKAKQNEKALLFLSVEIFLMAHRAASGRNSCGGLKEVFIVILVVFSALCSVALCLLLESNREAAVRALARGHGQGLGQGFPNQGFVALGLCQPPNSP